MSDRPSLPEGDRECRKAGPAPCAEPLPSLSICLPVHNEEGNLAQTVASAISLAPGIARRCEVLVVDDGSTDGTRELAERLAREHAEVQVIHHSVNRGYGAAVWDGLTAATGEWVFFTDADGQFDLSEVALLVPHTRQYDLVLGYRKVRRDNLYRRFLGRGWNMLVRLVLGVKVRDVNCAFKLMRRRLLNGISPYSAGAMVNAELLARLHRRGVTYTEVGITHYPRSRGHQSGSRPDVIVRALWELFRMSRRLKREDRQSR